MKRNIILWISAIILVFLLFYIKQITSSEYPLTGIISIGSSELLYRLEKNGIANEPIRILIHSDNKNLKGIVEWKSSGNEWQKTGMMFSNDTYSANIPVQNVGQKIFYRVVFIQDSVQKIIPSTKPLEMEIKGKIPGMLEFYYFLFLAMGMVLSTRTGLEFFNKKPKIKKLALITDFFFFGYLIFTPLKFSYEIGAINNFVPNITELFHLQQIVFLFIWVIATIIIFRSKNPGRIALTAALFSILNLFLH